MLLFPSPETIKGLDFSTIVGYTREPNMCSGGIGTIQRVLDKCRLPADARVLEVGCNTGFTTIEIASTTPHEVYGVDINPTSLSFARAKAASHGITNATFVQGDAMRLPFDDQMFNLLFVSNVTSFIHDRQAAVREYFRLLKPRAILAAAPIYYHRTPPGGLKVRVEEAIGAPIEVWDKSFWMRTFSPENAQLFFSEDYEYDNQPPERITEYTDMVMSQEHLKAIDRETFTALRDRLNYFYTLFNENLQYCRYSILLFRWQPANPEPILQTTRRVR